jgi:hypothetical protein
MDIEFICGDKLTGALTCMRLALLPGFDFIILEGKNGEVWKAYA